MFHIERKTHDKPNILLNRPPSSLIPADIANRGAAVRPAIFADFPTMHPFFQVLIIYSALVLLGALVIARFIWVAEVYPCEKCGVSPATRELAAGLQLCESCFLLFKEDQRIAVPFSEDAVRSRNEGPAANGASPLEPLSAPPQQPSVEGNGESRFQQVLK